MNRYRYAEHSTVRDAAERVTRERRRAETLGGLKAVRAAAHAKINAEMIRREKAGESTKSLEWAEAVGVYDGCGDILTAAEIAALNF